VVSPEVRGQWIRQAERAAQRPLEVGERVRVMRERIDEEVLLREAYREGLDQDEAIRAQLVAKMRRVLGGVAAEPTNTELRAWFAVHRARYEDPPVVSLEHVFYPRGEEAPADALARLRSGENPDGLGGELPGLGRFIDEASERELALLLGADAAGEVLNAPDGNWHGPVRSRSGVHFVRVLERLPAVVPELDAVRAYVVADWVEAQGRERLQAALERLRGSYDVIIDPVAR
jgi:hypothetical protein